MKIYIAIFIYLLLVCAKGIKREVNIVRMESRNDDIITFDKLLGGEYRIQIKQWIAEDYRNSLRIVTRFGSQLTNRYNEQYGSFCSENNSTDFGVFALIMRKSMGIISCPVEPGNYTGSGDFIFEGEINGGKENSGALDVNILNLYIEATKDLNDLDTFGIIYRLL